MLPVRTPLTAVEICSGNIRRRNEHSAAEDAASNPGRKPPSAYRHRRVVINGFRNYDPIAKMMFFLAVMARRRLPPRQTGIRAVLGRPAGFSRISLYSARNMQRFRCPTRFGTRAGV